ncbi:MAG: hypothetical protein JWO91_2992 [Acidobacteriaceae bacterium]|nr:hypothetical protein [Acidobacteriaceae bacterium]
MVTKKAGPTKRVAKAKAAPKKTVAKATMRRSKTASSKSAPVRKKELSPKRQRADATNFASPGLGADSGGQSGDLQGLSNVERADSESVDELLEEGNSLEAGVVAGVEEADNADEKELHTREVPEDDVPEEYLDEE